MTEIVAGQKCQEILEFEEIAVEDEAELRLLEEGGPSSSQVLLPPATYTFDEHAATTFQYFRKLRENDKFLDVTMECNGNFVTVANRLLLAAFSTHMEAALVSVPACTVTCLDFETKLLNVLPETLLEVVNFIYTGQCKVSIRLKLAAKALGCVSLTQILRTGDTGDMVRDDFHAARFQRKLQNYRLEGMFLDCSITIPNKGSIKCHRLLLCAHGLNFEEALLETQRSSQVTMNIDSMNMRVSSLDVKNIAEFVYLGVLRGHKRRFHMLRVSAFDLGVMRLVDLIDCHLEDEEQSANYATGGYELMPQLDEEDMYPVIGMENGQYPADYSGDEEEPVEDPPMTLDDFTAQATEDYVSIYEEYVLGPRRGRRGGTYGQPRWNQPLTVKGNTVVSMQETSQTRNGPVQSVRQVPAVMMSYTPAGQKKRKWDSFGYGLPEFVGTNDVAVPLVVGNQKEMMERPYKCPHCEHRAKEKSGIDKHVRCMHTGETPYKCKYCPMTFKVQSNLVRHIRAHTGEKPYACKKCGIAYADKKNMDAHIYREHLKMQPLICQFAKCTKRFWRHDRFALHCLKDHGSMPALPEAVSSESA